MSIYIHIHIYTYLGKIILQQDTIFIFVVLRVEEKSTREKRRGGWMKGKKKEGKRDIPTEREKQREKREMGHRSVTRIREVKKRNF